MLFKKIQNICDKLHRKRICCMMFYVLWLHICPTTEIIVYDHVMCICKIDDTRQTIVFE